MGYVISINLGIVLVRIYSNYSTIFNRLNISSIILKAIIQNSKFHSNKIEKKASLVDVINIAVENQKSQANAQANAQTNAHTRDQSNAQANAQTKVTDKTVAGRKTISSII